jgi:transcriptional regulator with XRE-family HTH domain
MITYNKKSYCNLVPCMEKDKFQKMLGQHIANLRKEKGISQIELGHLVDMETQNVNRLENGRTNPTAFTLHKICEALEIPLTKIFEFE